MANWRFHEEVRDSSYTGYVLQGDHVVCQVTCSDLDPSPDQANPEVLLSRYCLQSIVKARNTQGGVSTDPDERDRQITPVEASR